MNYTTPDIEVIAVKNDLVASASSGDGDVNGGEGGSAD